MRQKLNLTIEQRVIDQARQYATAHHRSLSSLVEEALARIAKKPINGSTDSLEAFHRKYLKPGFKVPTDRDVDLLRQGLKEKYS